MKSKKLLSLLLALAMVMSMAACGAKTNEPPATSGTPSETGAPATEELNWPTKEITLIQPWSLGHQPHLRYPYHGVCHPQQRIQQDYQHSGAEGLRCRWPHGEICNYRRPRQ